MTDYIHFQGYTEQNGAAKVDIYFHDETIWLTQKSVAVLFGVQVPCIAE